MHCSMPGFPVLHYPRVCSDSCPLSRWCHLTISSSATLFSFCLQSFPGSQLFTTGGQSISIGASASVLPINIQDRSPSEWTGWISLQSKGLSRVFSSTTVQKHQFFSAHPSLWSVSRIYTWLLDWRVAETFPSLLMFRVGPSALTWVNSLLFPACFSNHFRSIVVLPTLHVRKCAYPGIQKGIPCGPWAQNPHFRRIKCNYIDSVVHGRLPYFIQSKMRLIAWKKNKNKNLAYIFQLPESVL